MAGVRYDPVTRKRIGFVDPEKQAKLETALRQKAFAEKAMAAKHDLLAYTEFTMPDPAAPHDPERSRYRAAAFHRSVARHLEAVEKGEITQLIFCMPPRHGKACAHDTPVLTPSGWTTHGDLRPGDFVFGSNGEPTRVIALSQDVDVVVPVRLSNGEVIRCHPNHEWRVHDRLSRSGWRTMETRAIAARVLQHGAHFAFSLPDTPCVRYSGKTKLLLEPYVLGAWLGDGSAGSTRFAHAPSETEVMNRIAQYGHERSGYWVQEGTGVAYSVFAGPRPGVGSRMQRALKALGVLRNKSIPEAYLRAPREQRLLLLAGLIDTDGHVEQRTGRVRFSTCSTALRDGIVDLATGLGFRPYVSEVNPKLSSSGIQGRKLTFQVGFQPTEALPCALPRKRAWSKACRRRVTIVGIGPEERAGARSIQVEASDGLYLVGRRLNVTHNTELATKRLAAHYSGQHPEENIAVASYSDTMATDFGADTRAILTSAQHRQVFPNYRLRRGGAAKDNIQTDKGGRLVFVGRGGALTGRGAHLLLIDDLYKDHEEARSQAVRDTAWNWFTKVAMTRRMGRKLVILTMTRWHSDDVIGRLTDPENPCYNAVEAARWKIIRLPAIAEDDDPAGRPPGAPLWPDGPDRFDIDFLQSQQRIDPLGFEALYQQRPTVADGTLFRRENIRRYKEGEEPDDLRIYCASDHAVGLGQRNDPSCLIKVGVDRWQNIYVLECDWRRMPADVAVEAMLTMGTGERRPILWWAERGHISKSIGPFLHKRMIETGRYLNLREVTPVGDKQQRAQSIAARVATGKVFFPVAAPWAERAINEMMAFPNGVHDDFVDALAYIGLGLPSVFGASAPPSKADAPKFGTLAWVKLQDRWFDDQRRGAGGF